MAGGDVGCVALSNVSHLVTFLIALQSAALDVNKGNASFDPKTYIDLSLRKEVTLDEARAAFASLPTHTASSLQNFIATNFHPPGSELEVVSAPDFDPTPAAFLPNVKNPQILLWARHVHGLWKNLTRRQIAELVDGEDEDRSTMVPIEEPFVIPGSRFRENYYWDGYWIIRGLIVSRMVDTAKGMVYNMLDMVRSYGFVPNGSRKYYLNRSQPPLLSQMVRAVFEASDDEGLVRQALPLLVREHKFWNSAPHIVTIVDKRTGSKHILSRYYANWNSPRPESSVYDRQVAESLVNPTEEEVRQLYIDIATGAETGWDFSSRWMADGYNLSTLRTSKIVPADLNALLYQLERDIAFFAASVGDKPKTQKYFSARAERRRKAIRAILWNDEKKQWNDYWLPDTTGCSGPSTIVEFDKGSRNANVLASNFVPVWTGLLDEEEVATLDELVEALEQSGLLQPAGILTSLVNSSQQWDFPNGWAPLQHMIIEGLARSKSSRARVVAKEMAVRWLRTNYESFVRSGMMHEKYDVTSCGEAGGGGEYVPQTGFGWTNGVILALLETFGWPADQETNSCYSLD